MSQVQKPQAILSLLLMSTTDWKVYSPDNVLEVALGTYIHYSLFYDVASKKRERSVCSINNPE